MMNAKKVMHNIFIKIRKFLLTKAAIWIALSIGLALFSKFIVPNILATLEDHFLTLLATSLVLNIVLIALLWFIYKRSQFKLKYGLYWNKKKKPYCPNCKIPITVDKSGAQDYHCKKCQNSYTLKNKAGNIITPEQALAEL